MCWYDKHLYKKTPSGSLIGIDLKLTVPALNHQVTVYMSLEDQPNWETVLTTSW